MLKILILPPNFFKTRVINFSRK